MHPEMTSNLAGQHHREMTAAADRARLAAAARRPVRVRHPFPRAVLPRYRVTWSRTVLALADSAPRQRSWVIVISATRAR